MDTTVSSIIEARDDEITLRTSTSSKDFKDKKFTRAKLVVEIDRHRDAERKKEKKNKVSIPEAKDTEAKQDLVNKLLDCRRQVFKKNKTLKEDTLKGIEARFEKKGKSTKAEGRHYWRTNSSNYQSPCARLRGILNLALPIRHLLSIYFSSALSALLPRLADYSLSFYLN